MCRAWAAAAAAAPAVVDAHLSSNEHGKQVQAWLSKHGGVVVGLTAEGRSIDCDPLLQLPVAKLARLHSLSLRFLRVQRPVEAHAAGPGGE